VDSNLSALQLLFCGATPSSSSVYMLLCLRDETGLVYTYAPVSLFHLLVLSFVSYVGLSRTNLYLLALSEVLLIFARFVITEYKERIFF